MIASFASTGFVFVPGVLTASDCKVLTTELADHRGAGDRSLLSRPGFASLAVALRRHSILSVLLADAPVAVQCTRFDKTTVHNWLVPVHQDLGIPVASRIDDPSLEGWSVKDGMLFVQAPVALLEKMIAVRVHLDPCTAEDGPLRVVPESHRHGRLDADTAARLRDASGETVCTAKIGDAWVMRPLLLHASSKATGNSRRRVLHFLFGPDSLPLGLQWRHPV